MPIVDYPFKAHYKFSKPSPLLPIIITNPDNGFQFLTFGLIDTGADATTIPAYIAKKIGHDVESVKPISGRAAGGAVDVYEHTCSIDVLSMDENGNVNEDDIVISISRRRIGVINGLHGVLLGVDDFLKKFVVEINYPRKVFSVRRLTKIKISKK